MASQLSHADLEGDPRSKRRLLEDHGERLPCKKGLLMARLLLDLELLGRL